MGRKEDRNEEMVAINEEKTRIKPQLGIQNSNP
jgi:hypothetical protein